MTDGNYYSNRGAGDFYDRCEPEQPSKHCYECGDELDHFVIIDDKRYCPDCAEIIKEE
jgi:hypothetical protein